MGKRRKRYRDKFRHPSKLVPKVVGENWSERHQRRKDHALSSEDQLRDFCSAYAIFIKVTNDGHHWRFRRGSQLVEWWPSSAKLIINKEWKRGHHVHDYAVVSDFLIRFLLNDDLLSCRIIHDDDSQVESPAVGYFKGDKIPAPVLI